MTTHYRLYDVLYETGIHVKLETFEVVKETPQGYWVNSQYNPTWLSAEELRKRKYLKWVSKTSTKRYCYPTMEQAVNSFKRRKVVQASKLRFQLQQVDAVIDRFDHLSLDPKDYRPAKKLCYPDFMGHLRFD